jgi:phage terminase large subunit-like protein
MNPARDYCAIGLQYARDVLADVIPACKLVKDACRRQIEDLAKCDTEDWPWIFDEPRAVRVCRFVENLPHVEGGPWKSRNIILEPWQCFLLTTVFGWVNEEGYRRFRKVFVEIPRRNSKTTISAAIALYMLCADGELGAQVVSAAMTRDQAKISWGIASKMVKKEREMREYYGVEPMAHTIIVPDGGSTFKPLSRDADTLEGLNLHCAVIDELHVHKTREIFDVLNQGTGSRRQPLLFIITTAGSNKAGVCYEQHDYLANVLSGRHVDERYMGLMYGLDDSDDWTDKESHRKANPNYGVSVMPDDIQSICTQAQKSAAAQNDFLTKRLNVWVSVGSAYFNMLAWQQRCKSDKTLADFEGKRCIVAVDLASKDDIAVKLKLFNENGKRYIFAKYYLPDSLLDRGSSPNYDFYSGWAKAFPDRFTLTSGDTIDFEFIEQDLAKDREEFDVREVAFDPFNATEFSTRMLAEGAPMKEVGANVRNFSEPMKLIAALILAGNIKHDGDPILEWMMGNVYAKVDAKDNVFPRKSRYENKIDGAVALIMAINREIAGGASAFRSIYEDRGIESVG